MGYNRNLGSEELWAVISNEGLVLWTGGGSSTNPKLLVYETEKKANAALKYFDLSEKAKVVCVYKKV